MEQTQLFKNKEIFCFGSNLAGRHSKGAAKVALSRFGALYGKGYGLQGNSFAIPTKDEYIRTLSLNVIKTYVDNFKNFAQNNPKLTFNVTKIGCGLANYTNGQIAPFFKHSPINCIFDEEWKQYLGSSYQYFTNPL